MRLRKDLLAKAASWDYIQSRCPACLLGLLRTRVGTRDIPGMEHECLACGFSFVTLSTHDGGRRKKVVFDL